MSAKEDMDTRMCCNKLNILTNMQRGSESLNSLRVPSPPLNVPPRRINEIVHGKRSITGDAALRLSRYPGLSERVRLNLQSHYDLEVEKEKSRGRIEAEIVSRIFRTFHSNLIHPVMP